MGFLMTVYLTGVLVSALWLCLSVEITNPHKRFALSVAWPLVLLYGVYATVHWVINFVDDVNTGQVDIHEYLYNLVSGDFEDVDDFDADEDFEDLDFEDDEDECSSSCGRCKREDVSTDADSLTRESSPQFTDKIQS